MNKLLYSIVIILLCTGCSVRPLEKGARLSQEYDACVVSYEEAVEDAGDKFADEIHGNYDSRAKAVADYMQLLDECFREYQNKWAKIEQEERKVRRGMKSAADIADFETGLTSSREHCSFAPEPKVDDILVPPVVLQQLRTIFPTKPNEQTIQSDLVGHSLSEGKQDGYYPQSWKWVIKENSISDFRIISIEEDSKTRYSIVANMRLSSDTRAFDAKVLICYVLDDIHDWQIEFIQSKGMDIVKTHRYDDCVKCYITGGISGGLVGENNSEIALEVAGHELTCSGKWVTFCRLIPPHKQTLISYSDYDFRVDYIERP